MNKKLKLEELNRKTVEEYKDSPKIPVVVILDNIRSLNNVGSFFRTCDAFGVESLYLCGITATPPHREISKTAIGATESVNWKYFSSAMECVEILKNKNFIIISVEQTQQSIQLEKLVLDRTKKYAFVFGNEVDGVEQEVVNSSHMSVELNQIGTKHSLNVAVCGGVVLWEARKYFQP